MVDERCHVVGDGEQGPAREGGRQAVPGPVGPDQAHAGRREGIAVGASGCRVQARTRRAVEPQQWPAVRVAALCPAERAAVGQHQAAVGRRGRGNGCGGHAGTLAPAGHQPVTKRSPTGHQPVTVAWSPWGRGARLRAWSSRRPRRFPGPLCCSCGARSASSAATGWSNRAGRASAPSSRRSRWRRVGRSASTACSSGCGTSSRRPRRASRCRTPCCGFGSAWLRAGWRSSASGTATGWCLARRRSPVPVWARRWSRRWTARCATRRGPARGGPGDRGRAPGGRAARARRGRRRRRARAAG